MTEESTEKSIIETGKVAYIHYHLRNTQGETLDSSEGAEPMPYLQGAGNIVPGLESALDGKTVGDHIRVVVPPEDGYGLRDEESVKSVPLDEMPKGLELVPGIQLMAEDQDGHQLIAWVLDVNDKEVRVDFNHPLAGVALDFEIDVVSIRDATEDELEAGCPEEMMDEGCDCGDDDCDGCDDEDCEGCDGCDDEDDDLDDDDEEDDEDVEDEDVEDEPTDEKSPA